jgi:hypothetical protein
MTLLRATRSSISFDKLKISLYPAGSRAWVVRVVARVHGGSRVRGDLIVQPVFPLGISQVTSDYAQKSEGSADGDGDTAIRLLAPEDAKKGWDGAEISFELTWREDADAVASNSVSVPCLVLPDMLPRLIEATDPLGADAPLRMARISFDEELPGELDAGGISIPDRKGRGTAELLQTVIFRATNDGPRFNDLAVAAGQSRADASQLQRAYEYVSPLLEFVKRDLLVSLPVRPVICLSNASPSEGYRPVGADCPLPPSYVGAVQPDVGKPVSVIRLLTLGWLGGGVRLWGENSVSVELALGGAIGLRCVSESGAHAFVQRALADLDARITAAHASGTWSADDLVRSIQLPLFHGLRDDTLRRVLGRLIQQHWGEFLPQSELITLLRSRGVSVPNVFG